MIDKIILNIRHSDDYTDYLFLTAGLTNKRIVPLVDPTPETLKAQSDTHTLVLRCYNSRKLPDLEELAVTVDSQCGSIRVLSQYYLKDDGTILPTQATLARETIQEAITSLLMSPRNRREVFIYHFPLIWRKRQLIYDTPRLFFASSGRYDYDRGQSFPLGAVLKAIEEDPGNFRLALGGGCHCSEKPILTDYDRIEGEWVLSTWCPVCRARREIKAEFFARYWDCDQSVRHYFHLYDKGQGLSPMTLFDVVDELKGTAT